MVRYQKLKSKRDKAKIAGALWVVDRKKLVHLRFAEAADSLDARPCTHKPGGVMRRKAMSALPL